MQTKNSFLTKKSFQKNPPKKIRQKISLKKFLQKNPLEKSSRKIPKQFHKNSFQKNFQTISKQFLKPLLRFWKHPIPYIALIGRKPFLVGFTSNSLYFWQLFNIVPQPILIFYLLRKWEEPKFFGLLQKYLSFLEIQIICLLQKKM